MLEDISCRSKYFFPVKETKNEMCYLCQTESILLFFALKSLSRNFFCNPGFIFEKRERKCYESCFFPLIHFTSKKYILSQF